MPVNWLLVRFKKEMLLQEERESATSPENLFDDKSRCWREEQSPNEGNPVVRLLQERSKCSKFLQSSTGTSPEILFPLTDKYWSWPQPPERSHGRTFCPKILL